MTDTDYHNQRLLGAQQIIVVAEEMAHEAGLVAMHCEWDHGRPMIEKDNHTFKLSCGKSVSQETFSDEEITDFLGKVGTQPTRTKITAMIRTLREDAL